MEQSVLKEKKQKVEVAKQFAAPTETQQEVVPVEDVTQQIVVKPNYGAQQFEEQSDADHQVKEMRIINGYILKHLRKAIVNKELSVQEELQVFKETSKYMNYGMQGNKSTADTGMEAFAMRYLEIGTHLANKAKKSSAK